MNKLLNILAVITVACVVRADPKNCKEAYGIEVDPIKMNGTWYETGRVPSSSFGCIKLTANPTNSLHSINVDFSSSNSSLVMSKKVSFTIDTNNNSFIINAPGFINNAIMKVLSVNYTSNAKLCGYTDKDNGTDWFGVILTRSQIISDTTLMQYATEPTGNFSLTNFNNISAVNQSGCMASGASPTVPTLTAIVSTLYAIFKSVAKLSNTKL